MTKRVSILGSTGSVGSSTIELIERQPEAYRVEALTAHRNAELLAAQARRVTAALAVIGDEGGYADLKRALAGSGIEAAAGAAAVVEAAGRRADWVMAAIVGAAGLEPTLEAVRQGTVVALANKECLVCAGNLLLEEVTRSGSVLLPVDSEHNAIFQVFEQRQNVEKIILTASGGPFRTAGREEMRTATPEAAVAHPNWRMGAKISVDSATMMNKGLELIEAHYLFEMPENRIDILIHPQSIVHSLVCYVDGSVLAQLGAPDMRTPIAHTLGWPKRIGAPSARLDLGRIATLTFEPPDAERFPALSLAREALREGGNAPIVLNASNEEAVDSFLAERIGFLDIVRVVEETLRRFEKPAARSVAEVTEIDRAARRTAGEIISRMK